MEFMISGALGESAFLRCQLQSLFAVQLRLTHQLIHAVCKTLRSITVRSLLIARKRTDQQSNFTSRGFFGERCGKLGEQTAAKLLMDLCDFARDAGWPIAKNFLRIRQRFLDAVRRLVKNDGAVFNPQTLQSLVPELLRAFSTTPARG